MRKSVAFDLLELGNRIFYVKNKGTSCTYAAFCPNWNRQQVCRPFAQVESQSAGLLLKPPVAARINQRIISIGLDDISDQECDIFVRA